MRIPIFIFGKELLADDRRSAQQLVAATGLFEEDQVEEPILSGQSSAYKKFQGSVEHVHCHLG